ncbi:MAG: VOC family protein [Marinosulfonomonas sp.]|nr:VOC family protein [Marinosulfonomonas sp.]
MQLDHIAISAENLVAGVAHIEAILGVPLAPGGAHPNMGTHNRLLSLGSGQYLEVIAIDPAAPAPDWPRWFDLDNFTGAPRLTNWILRVDDMDAALQNAPAGTGRSLPQTRGDLAWKMAVPEDGKLPFSGAFAGLIEWQGQAHPSQMLPDAGCRLKKLEITHPDAEKLTKGIRKMGEISDVELVEGPEIVLKATIQTPGGIVGLQ